MGLDGLGIRIRWHRLKTLVFNEDVIGPWVCARTGGKFDGMGTAIGLEEDGRIIAGVLYDGFNGRSICMHVASDGSRGWMTREYLRVCFDYPFRQLGVCKILGLVDSKNLAARQFDEALGFKLECEIPDAGPVGSLCIYSMTPSDCRFLQLKERHGRKKLPTC